MNKNENLNFNYELNILKNENKLLSEKVKILENENKEFKEKINYFLKKIQELEMNIYKINNSKNQPEIMYNNNLNINNNNEIKEKINDEIIQFFNKEEINKVYLNYYNCVFSNKERLQCNLNNIKNKIEHTFKVYNNGKEFPKDTIIRCINNDSEIYFNSVKIKQSFQKYKNYWEFPVEILIKDFDDIKKGDKYELEYYLLSDREGKIHSKNNGKLEILLYDINNK